MVKNITRPLVRMTRTTELIAKGRFDVTIHEPRADEIGRLARAINHMTLHLSDFVKGQKRFLGDVAHELGSPIARIHFGLAALESRTQRENRERVAGIMEDMDHLSQLVNELLAFSRAEMNKSAVKLESIALLPAVEAAVKREASPQARITVTVDPDIRVMASAELLTRALANVIRNAVKYAGGGCGPGPGHCQNLH
jgi:two-component system sensor histidine kinase CpxA